MIRENIDLVNILISFESILTIDYNDRDIDKLKRKVRQRLSDKLKVRIDKGLEQAQSENILARESVDSLMSDLFNTLKSMALLTTVTVFDKQYTETIKDLNYLGFAKESLLGALKYLQDKDLYERRNTFMGALCKSLESVSSCNIKRLLVIMVVLEDLELKEGVALIAQYLYLGGL